MGQPDLTEKLLLNLNDEFAEVFSAFAFKNKHHLKPDRLREAATEYHHLELGKAKELRRDIVKIYDGLQLGILILGIENQSEIDPIMPIRMMGYDWTRYRHQVSQTEELPPKHMLAPVFSHVINFSYTQKWDWPLSLKNIVSVPPGLEEFFQDYTIEVTNVAWLTPQERSVLTGDFKILADTLCAIRETGKIPGGTKIIRHVEELLATLAAVTHRKYAIDISTEQFHAEGGSITMDDVLTKWEDELRAEGEKVGYKNGENRSAVRTFQYLGKTENETMLYLMQEYGMTQEEARSTTLKYWK